MTHPVIASVLAGDRPYGFVAGECVPLLKDMEPGSVDLILGSPPYEDARTYGIDFNLKGQDWVDWMVEFFRAAVPVTRGLVVMVVGHGKTYKYRWSATPSLLEADLHRAGFDLRCPSIYYRHGVQGSGGKDYFRYDHEWCVTVQNRDFAVGKGRNRGRLPWSNNVAFGHPPVYGPGGANTNRTASGRRVNQWGMTANGEAQGNRRKDGQRQKKGRPSHVSSKRAQDGTMEVQQYRPPTLANPGTVIKCKVGGGHMGHPLAHENEAPYPASLAERFVLSFCPPGGVVLDPFSGSGTTVHVAHHYRRRGIGIDLRDSQVELATRRLAGVTPLLMVPQDDEHTERAAAVAARV